MLLSSVSSKQSGPFRSFLQESNHTPFLHPAAWNVDMITGASAAILDYKDKGHSLEVVNQ